MTAVKYIIFVMLIFLILAIAGIALLPTLQS